MTWALRRQIFYILILVLFISVFGFLIIYPKLNKAPTCTDYKQNGDELGVDCGGSCVNACLSQVDNISVLWARAFRVIPGRYNAVAYLVNHNTNVGAEKINYRFRFADKDNLYIGKREGNIFVPPGGNFVVFEPGIDIGNSIPVYSTFEFTDVPQWKQVSQEKINQLKILTSNIQLVDEETFPKLSATIKNTSLFTIPNVGVVAILYDVDGNAISTSRTYLTKLSPLQSTDINFTWPEPLPGVVVEKEIIPMYDIFSAKLE
ncbi:MAG: FxLYD domain-containing protein [Minisyncoccia bacterium]